MQIRTHCFEIKKLSKYSVQKLGIQIIRSKSNPKLKTELNCFEVFVLLLQTSDVSTCVLKWRSWVSLNQTMKCEVPFSKSWNGKGVIKCWHVTYLLNPPKLYSSQILLWHISSEISCNKIVAKIHWIFITWNMDSNENWPHKYTKCFRENLLCSVTVRYNQLIRLFIRKFHEITVGQPRVHAAYFSSVIKSEWNES